MYRYLIASLLIVLSYLLYKRFSTSCSVCNQNVKTMYTQNIKRLPDSAYVDDIYTSNQDASLLETTELPENVMYLHIGN